MYYVDGILIDGKIANTNFNCDLEKCKGACCTFPGERGAPLKDEELHLIQDSYDAAKQYLSEDSRKYIEEHGWWQGSKGDYTTNCINNKDCVFVYYEGEIAFCSIEKAYRKGECDFIKPVSCHLFPIRVRKNGNTSLVYEKIPECNPALSKGQVTNMKIYQLAKDGLVRSFGGEWLNNFEKAIEE